MINSKLLNMPLEGKNKKTHTFTKKALTVKFLEIRDENATPCQRLSCLPVSKEGGKNTSFSDGLPVEAFQRITSCLVCRVIYGADGWKSLL